MRKRTGNSRGKPLVRKLLGPEPPAEADPPPRRAAATEVVAVAVAVAVVVAVAEAAATVDVENREENPRDAVRTPVKSELDGRST